MINNNDILILLKKFGGKSMKLLRKNYKDFVIRKLYQGKKSSQSLICNIPLKFAENLKMNPGNYVKIIETTEGLLLKKIEMEDN